MNFQDMTERVENPTQDVEKAILLGNLDSAMQAVEESLMQIVESDVQVLRETSQHILDAGGKRLRPRLLLLSFAAAGGTDYMAAVPLAAAVELVHTASVVHDDINDHGVMRRGRPSVNALWGRTFALLTGDFLFTKVYELMAPYKDLNVVLAEAVVALVEGETLQASAVKDGNFSREIYFQIISRKTAALFRAAMEIGARLANGTREQIDLLSNYGLNVGLAFQIVDDLLDLGADSDTLGKTAGVDLEQGKGIAAIYDQLRNEISENGDSRDIVNRGQQQARDLVRRAVEQLNGLAESAEKRELVDVARLVVERDH